VWGVMASTDKTPRLLDLILAEPDDQRVTLHLLGEATGYRFLEMRNVLRRHSVPFDGYRWTVRVGDLRGSDLVG